MKGKMLFQSGVGTRRAWIRGALAVPLMTMLLAVATAVEPTAGQEPEGAKASAKSEKKPSGRLPAYYGQVVSQEQRARIYGIQGKYADQIQKLRDQIIALEKQQMDEVVAVLSTEQRDQIAKMVADAKAKRSKKPGATDSGTNEKSGTGNGTNGDGTNGNGAKGN